MAGIIKGVGVFVGPGQKLKDLFAFDTISCPGEVRIALKSRFHIQQPYPTTNKSLRFWPRPWTLAPFDDLSKWRVFFTFATSIFLTVRPGFLEVKHFPFPLRSNFLQAPLESGLFYRNILCGEKCCLTATADWIGRLGRGLVKGFLRWVGHLFTFWWEVTFLCAVLKRSL